MKIVKSVTVGTTESSDVQVTVGPGEGKRQIVIDSVVASQYYYAIVAAVNEVLDAWQANDIYVMLLDKGALDFVIRARLETALKRAGGDTDAL